MCMCVYVYAYVYAYAFIYVYVHVDVDVCVCIDTHVHVYIYVCVYIFTCVVHSTNLGKRCAAPQLEQPFRVHRDCCFEVLGLATAKGLDHTSSLQLANQLHTRSHLSYSQYCGEYGYI